MLANTNSLQIEGFSAFAYNDRVYVWGGTLEAKVTST